LGEAAQEKNMYDFAGKTVIITGGTDGLGLEMAHRFARAGASLFVVGKEQEGVSKAEKDLSKHGTHVEVSCLDLCDRSDIGKLIDQATKLPQVDVLVNNVGIIGFTPFNEVTNTEFDAFVDVSLRSSYFLTQALVSSLAATGGNVINMSSYFATKILPDRTSTLYSMIKGAMTSLTRAQAFELGPHGIRVNALAPGTVESPGRTAGIQKMDPDSQQKLMDYNARSYPIGRIGAPSDVANATLFLASEQASWITGTVLTVDGGLTAG
jgi:NAD(P)-dependent dehydrogenase (short-subunit alcohol dehydrogenase family)